MRRSTTVHGTILFLAGLMAGCHVAGPASVRTGRADYNIAIQKTNGEQLLLNLVRLRYRDVPCFLEVASVSTNFEVVASASGSVSLPESAGKAYGLGAGVGVTESPTVTYSVLQGDQFVAQLMSPIQLNTLILLYHSGWSVERIFRVCLQSLNGIKNAPSASGPTPQRVPKYEKFLEVARLLRTLQVRDALTLGYAGGGGKENPVVEMRIAEEAADWKEVKRLRELLGLDPGGNRFPLTTEAGSGGKDRIAVVTRSMISSLFYVSQSVEVPSADERAGRVTVTRDANGKRFDWGELTGELMRIRSSALPPCDDYVAVHYRGSWFSIDDSDLTSKSTFSLLAQLFSLQAGDVKSAGPILTLPVSR